MKRKVTIIALFVLLFLAPSVFAVRNFEGKEIADTDLQKYNSALWALYSTAGTAEGIDTKIVLYEKLLKKCYEKKGVYYTTLFNLGHFYRTGINDTKLIGYYKEMIEIDSGHPWSSSFAYTYLYQKLTKREKDGIKEAQRYAKLFKDKVGDIKCDLYLGNYETANSKIAESFEKGETIVLEPVLSVYIEVGKETEVIALLDKEVEILSKDIKKEAILDEVIKDEGARNVFNAVIRGYAILAKSSAENRKDYNKAVEILEKFKSVLGRNNVLYKEALESLGNNYLSLKERKKALESYKEIIDGMDKSNKIALRIYPKIANIYVQELDYESALGLFKKFDDIEGIAMCLGKLNRSSEAIDMIDKMLEELEK